METQADDGIPTISADDPLTPCAAAPLPPQNTAKIPLQAGTVVTTAWGLKNGDVEDRDSVTSTDATSVCCSRAIRNGKTTMVTTGILTPPCRSYAMQIFARRILT